jgi:hypothetical protein
VAIVYLACVIESVATSDCTGRCSDFACRGHSARYLVYSIRITVGGPIAMIGLCLIHALPISEGLFIVPFVFN